MEVVRWWLLWWGPLREAPENVVRVHRSIYVSSCVSDGVPVCDDRWCCSEVGLVVYPVILCGACVANYDVLYEKAFGVDGVWCVVHVLNGWVMCVVVSNPAENERPRMVLWYVDCGVLCCRLVVYDLVLWVCEVVGESLLVCYVVVNIARWIGHFMSWAVGVWVEGNVQVVM